MQILQFERCEICGEYSDEICDICAGTRNVANVICPAHGYTRNVWDGQQMFLCDEHEQQIRAARTILRDELRLGAGDMPYISVEKFEPYVN